MSINILRVDALYLQKIQKIHVPFELSVHLSWYSPSYIAVLSASSSVLHIDTFHISLCAFFAMVTPRDVLDIRRAVSLKIGQQTKYVR